jgi:tripartite ATP-independent transporter DctP family solute receptor
MSEQAKSAFRIAAIAAGLLAAGGTAAAQEVTLRASGSFPAGHTASIGMEIFKSELERLSKGQVKVELFPGNVLGGAFEQVDQVRTGQIAIAWAGSEWFTRAIPELDAAVLPFAASTAQQAFCMIDSDLGDLLNKKSADKGLVILGWMSNGSRHVTNNKRPIKSVDDLKGLKIRTPPSEIFLATFRAVGANATPIDIKELYQALQQGVVDGQENPYDNIQVRKFDEVQKYLSNTGHFYSWSVTFMNKKAFDGLKKEHQDAVREAGFRAVAAQRALAERENAKSLQTLIKRGMKYDPIPPAELAKFRDATRPVYEQVRKSAGNEVVDLTLKAIKDCQ